jgi:hypothetical protein
MINKIKIYIILIFILLMVLLIKVDREFFYTNRNYQRSSRNMNGYFSIVDLDWRTEDGYSDELGPTCVATCIKEHVPVWNFRNQEYPQGSIANPLQWNYDNPRLGYCYRANSNDYPFECGSDCQSKCGNDSNQYGADNNYDPELDLSNCEVDTQLGCVEKQLNPLTGCGVQNSVGCIECLRTYLPNLTALKAVVDEVVAEASCGT